MAEYKRLNIELLKRNGKKTASTEEALKDITPFAYSKNVIDGTVKIIVDKADGRNV